MQAGGLSVENIAEGIPSGVPYVNTSQPGEQQS